jgi:23S rRNA C2498 (ribose-2'-O)-methylase RlmM
MKETDVVKRLAAMTTLSSVALNSTLVNQMKLTAMQVRHSHLLHLFEVAHQDVLDHETSRDKDEAAGRPVPKPSSDRQLQELVNARSALSLEADNLIVQITNAESQTDDDLAEIQRINMEIQNG